MIERLMRARYGCAPAVAACLLLAAPSSALAVWSPPTDLSPLDGNSDFHQLASDGKGNLAAIWRHGTVSDNVPQVRTRATGGSWGAVQQLAVEGSSVLGTAAGISPSGEAVLMWLGQRNGSPLIQWSSGPLAGPFGPPQPLTEPSQDVGTPAIAADAEGNATALWTQSDGASQIVRSATRPPGGAFGPPQDLSAPGQSAYYRDLAVAPSGEAIAVWSRANGQNGVVQASIRLPGGAFGPPQDLSLPDAAADQSRVAINARGDAIAVWITLTDLGAKLVEAARRLPGGEFGRPFRVSGVSDPGLPQVGLDARGNAVVVWLDHNNGDLPTEVLERDLSAEGSAPPVSSLSYTPGNATTPSLALNADGAALVAWDSEDAGFTANAVARQPGGAFSAPHDLSPPSDNAFLPLVSIDASGSGAAIWLGHNEGRTVIQESDYAPGGDEPPPPLEEILPTVFRIEPRRFAIRGRSAVATFRFWSPGRARATIKISRLPGRRCTRRCREIRVGRLPLRSARKGDNAVRFNGWVGGEPLRPGLYEATLVRRFPAGKVWKESTRFVVARGRR